MKEQIKEMAKHVCQYAYENCDKNCPDGENCTTYSTCKLLYNAGYRKQSEGEWVKIAYKTVEHGFAERIGVTCQCTNCLIASSRFDNQMKFCPNCGAKMKGVNEL